MLRVQLRRAAAGFVRRFGTATEDGTDKLSRWLQEWVAVPRVVVPDGTEPPTALSWLRRRGPPLPQSALHRLFRQNTVRLYDPTTQRVGRVSKARQLPPGAMLLLPKAAVSAAGAADDAGRDSSGAGSRPPAGRPQLAPAQQRAVQQWLAELRRGLLHISPEFLAVNKPAGLACQGGSGLAVSLDGLMGEAFGQVAGVQPRQLRLVHRLDRQTTGALLIAKDPDAAAWLAAAFKEGSLSSSGDGSSGRRDNSSGSGSGSGSGSPARRAWGAQPGIAGKAAAPGSIQKTYWAVVAREEHGSEAWQGQPAGGPARLAASQHRADQPAGSRSNSRSGGSRGWLPPAGTIRLPVPSSKDPAALQPAETRFRVLQQGPRLALLELRPATGRKHQLRLHCSRGLGAAILGDGRYGALRSGAQQAALAALRAAVAGAEATAPGTRAGRDAGSGEAPLFLHCRRLEVRRPGGGGVAVEVTAPLPPAWRLLLEQQGWPLPEPPLQ